MGNTGKHGARRPEASRRHACDGLKKGLRPLFVLFLGAVQRPVAYAQDSVQAATDFLMDIFFQSTAYPEKFDNYLAIIPEPQNPSLNACMNELALKYRDAAVRRNQKCGGKSGSAYHQCLTKDEPTKFYSWLVNIAQTFENGGSGWTNTMSGGAFLAAKRTLARSTGRNDLWPRVIKDNLHLARPYLDCSRVLS